MRPCDARGAIFTPKRCDGRFCSKDCYHRGHAADARNKCRARVVAMKPCDVCGGDFTPKRHDMRYCSKDCGNRARNDRRMNPATATMKHCGQCGAAFQSTLDFHNYCSPTCRRRARHERVPKVGRWTGPKPRTVEATCRVCSARFSCTRRDARYCSQTCYGRDELTLTRAHDHRARRRGAFVARVNKFHIFVRDEWTCGLCDAPVLQQYRWPHPMSASLDHIVPLSVGGTHEPANVQLAHLRCNLRKGNRVALVA